MGAQIFALRTVSENTWRKGKDLFIVYSVYKECCYWLRVVYRKCTEPLSFDRPTETDVVKRSPPYTKVLVSFSARNRTKKRKGIEAWRVQPLTPTRATDMLIGD